jgi:hypothetical protein
MEWKVVDLTVEKTLGQFRALDEKISHFTSVAGLVEVYGL